MVTAETATAIVDETDQVWLAAFPHAVAVCTLAARGEVERAAVRLAAARAAAAEAAVAQPGCGRPAAVRSAWSRFDGRATVAAGGDPSARWPGTRVSVVSTRRSCPWRAGYAEALAAVGRAGGRRLGGRLARPTRRPRRPEPAGGGGGARARIAAVALAAGTSPRRDRGRCRLSSIPSVEAPGRSPMGRLGLATGAGLARGRSAANGPAAVAGAPTGGSEALGAAPWARPGASASWPRPGAGGRPRSTAAGTGGPIATPREQAVAHIVARGEHQPGGGRPELFLSVKTVEHRLTARVRQAGRPVADGAGRHPYTPRSEPQVTPSERP